MPNVNLLLLIIASAFPLLDAVSLRPDAVSLRPAAKVPISDTSSDSGVSDANSVASEVSTAETLQTCICCSEEKPLFMTPCCQRDALCWKCYRRPVRRTTDDPENPNPTEQKGPHCCMLCKQMVPIDYLYENPQARAGEEGYRKAAPERADGIETIAKGVAQAMDCLKGVAQLCSPAK